MIPLDKRQAPDSTSTNSPKAVIRTLSKANTIRILSIILTNKNHTNNGKATSEMSITNFTKMWDDKAHPDREVIHMEEMSGKGDQIIQVWRCLLFTSSLVSCWWILSQESCSNVNHLKRNFTTSNDTKERLLVASKWSRVRWFTLHISLQLMLLRKSQSHLEN